MKAPYALQLPLNEAAIASLCAGDELRLSGLCYTARDATCERLLALVREQGALPEYLRGQLLFYAGPTPPRAGRPFGSIGPTTAKRMDAAQAALMPFGLKHSLGKGQRSAAFRAAAREHGALFLAAVGGAAAILARHVVAAEVVAWPELGTEALTRLELRDFPAVVALDLAGTDLYERNPQLWREQSQATATLPLAATSRGDT
jgi:fumarate hydratase class I/fumarate hydratase subunit beta